MTYRIFGLVLCALAAVGATSGCGDSSESTAASSGKGVRGESCVATPDCGGGLACVAGVCSVRTFELMVTQNECVRIGCREAKDCLPRNCRTLETACDGGDAFACDEYDAQCDASQYLCESDQCVQLCDTSAECPGTCVEGRCADCGSDDDCGGDYICVDRQCVQGCEEKADCPFFHDCQAGQCAYTGCSTNRECIAATGSARAICDATECVVPCDTDIECDEPYSFDFVQCVSGRCMPIGCESDAECRIRLDVDLTEDPDDAECRPATSPPSLPGTREPDSSDSSGSGSGDPLPL